jgi:hypothetical protein
MLPCNVKYTEAYYYEALSLTMTIIAGYISSSGVLLGADSGYRKVSEDVEIDKPDITDKIQKASENVVIGGMGYHRYMRFVQTGLAENIHEETKLEEINKLLVDFARESYRTAQEQNYIKKVPPSKLKFSIWIAGVRPESSGGFLSKLDVDLTKTDVQFEPTVMTERRTYGIDIGGTDKSTRTLPDNHRDTLVERIGHLPFGKWFTDIVDTYRNEKNPIDFPAQMYYITPEECYEEHYSGIDERNSPFNTLDFEN